MNIQLNIRMRNTFFNFITCHDVDIQFNPLSVDDWTIWISIKELMGDFPLYIFYSTLATPCIMDMTSALRSNREFIAKRHLQAAGLTGVEPVDTFETLIFVTTYDTSIGSRQA